MGALGGAALLGSPATSIDGPPWRRLQNALDNDPERQLDRLEASVASIWASYNYTASSRLLGPILWGFQEASQLLEQPFPPHFRSRLQAHAGELARIAGWLSFDLHDHDSAGHYYEVALLAAEQAGSISLAAHILGCASFLALVDGEPVRALATLVRAKDNRLVPPALRAWIAAIEGEAHAAAGDRRACEEALDRSEHILEEGERSDFSADEVFDDARRQGFHGACLIRFGKISQAEKLLESALVTLDPSLSRQRSNVLTDLALVRLHQREIEESCRILGRALDIAATTRQAVGLSRIRLVRLQLEPYRADCAVTGLDERLLTV